MGDQKNPYGSLPGRRLGMGMVAVHYGVPPAQDFPDWPMPAHPQINPSPPEPTFIPPFQDLRIPLGELIYEIRNLRGEIEKLRSELGKKSKRKRPRKT